MPMVSVIIPTYNRADLVSETIDSVLAQSYRDFEVIVVDDGSTDASGEVLARYGEQIRVVLQENAGEAVARNAGIRVASGEYVGFLDSDDIWLPPKLAPRQGPVRSANVPPRIFQQRPPERRAWVRSKDFTSAPCLRLVHQDEAIFRTGSMRRRER